MKKDFDKEGKSAINLSDLGNFCQILRGASGGCLQGGASFEVEKAHSTARKKGPGTRKNEVNLRPPLCRPLKHSMKIWPQVIYLC